MPGIQKSRAKTPVWLIVLVTIGGIIVHMGELLWFRERIVDQRRLTHKRGVRGPGPWQQPIVGPLRNDAVLRHNVQRSLDDLGDAFKVRDVDTALTYFDMERLGEEMCVAAEVPVMPMHQKQRVVRALEDGAAGRFIRSAGWTQTVIKKIDVAPGGDEAVVYVRHFDADTRTRSVMRWWIRKVGERIRFFDYEDMDTSLRVSQLGGDVLFDLRGGKAPAWLPALRSFAKVQPALNRNDLVTAERELKAAAGARFPDKLEAARLVARGAVAMRRFNNQQALEYYRKAEKLNSDMSGIGYLYSMTLNNVGRHEESIRRAEKYIALLGDDQEITYELGYAHARLGQKKEAADALRRCLKLAPEHSTALNELRRVLPNGQKHEIAMYLRKMEHPEDIYENLGNNAFRDRDAVGLATLASAMRFRFPRYARAIFDAARAKVLEKKYKEALPLFKLAMKKQWNQAQRKQYLSSMLYALSDAGKPLLGYHAAEDRREAFRIMANDMWSRRKHAELRQLLNEHQKKYSKDAIVHYYKGRIAVQEDRLHDAVKHLSVIDFTKIPVGERGNMLREYVNVHFQLDKGMEIYKASPVAEAVFAELAPRYNFRDLPEKKLKDLVELHRKRFPNDDNGLIWDLELKWRAKDYTNLAKAFEQHRHLLSDRVHGRKHRQNFLFALYALNRLPDAAREIRRLIEGAQNQNWYQLRPPFFLLVDAKQAESALHYATVCVQEAPDHPEALMMMAEAQIANNNIKSALEAFGRAFKAEADDYARRNHQVNLLTAMSRAGHALAGYRAAPDRAAAFTTLATLANSLPLPKKLNTLKELCQEHQQNSPDDPWLAFYHGQLALTAKNYAQAEQLFSKGLQIAPTFNKHRFRRRLLFTRFHSKGAAEAYRAAGPKPRTFTDVALYCTKPEHAASLQKLIAAHRQHFPKDTSLPVWQAEVHWLTGDYNKVVTNLRQHTQLATLPGRQWKYYDRLVRGLLRLKRFDEAQQELARMRKTGSKNLLLQAAAHACAGEVADTTRLLKRCQKNYYTNKQFYDDPDLGPMLRTPKFAEVRRLFPAQPLGKHGIGVQRQYSEW